MIKITVAIPVWNNKDIAWLCLESLRRQKDIDFEWEIMVFEEEHSQQLGEEYFFKYLSGISITYHTQPNKLSLGQKWYKMINAAHPDSKGMVFCDADDYCHPYVLRESLDAFCSGYDWLCHENGYFYDFITGGVIQYSSRKKPGIRLSARMDIAKRLPNKVRPRLMHAWFNAHMKPQNMLFSQTDHWKNGLFTNGHNSISKSRDRYFRNPVNPFRKTDMDLEDIVPKEVAERIRAMGTNQRA